MNLLTITKPNQKGQVVIPKKIRDSLGINANVLLQAVIKGGGVYLYPIRDIVKQVEHESSYLKILSRTKGAWADENWQPIKARRKKIEFRASQKRKQAW